MTIELCRCVLDQSKYHLITEIINWCWQTIGPGARTFDIDLLTAQEIDWGEDRWLMKTTFGVSVFVFRENKDAALFLLKWQS